MPDGAVAYPICGMIEMRSKHILVYTRHNKDAFNKKDTFLLYCVSNHAFRQLESGGEMSLQPVAGAGIEQPRVGDNLPGGPGGAANQQTRFVLIDVQ